MRILIGIPAYNEEATISSVINVTRQVLPTNDIVVVDDGSRDRTAEIVRTSHAILLQLPCNLGYSHAIETLLNYAFKNNYDALALIDADGQHDPQMLTGFLDAFEKCNCNMQIGSRYIQSRQYGDAPLGRRLGMVLFSNLTKFFAGKRIFDTTSGMKAVDREAMRTLIGWQFADFHAEAIIYLLWMGLKVEEYPIVVKEREYGESMYSFISHLWYPLTVLLMIAISLVNLLLSRLRRKKAL